MSLRINPRDARSGRVVRTRHIGDLTLTETVFGASSVVPPHMHERSRLCFVLEGGFTEQTSGSATSSGAGSLLFHPCDEPHAQRYDDAPARCLIIELGRSFVSRLSELNVAVPSTPTVARHRTGWLAMRLYRELLRPDSVSDLAIESLAVAILTGLQRDATLASSDPPTPRWLTFVQDVLDARYMERVRLSELAAAVGVHPVHLSRVFHRRVGVTLTAYVRERRLERASERLLRTDLPCWRIALEAGFRDQFHFARAFRDATGMTPREFRSATLVSSAMHASEAGGRHRLRDAPTPAWLPSLLEFLDEGCRRPIRMTELAARAGVHPRNLATVFRRRVGVSLTDYVRRRRIDWASERLIATTLPLSRIAMEAGFTDQAHFARLFKRATGLTPRAFRAAR